MAFYGCWAIILPTFGGLGKVLLMIQILHYLKDPKLWELWYVPHYGSCRIYIINRRMGFRAVV